MNSVYDIQQLLKRYGIFIYTGDRNGDLQLMEFEIHELHDSHLLTINQYIQAKLLLRREINRENS